MVEVDHPELSVRRQCELLGLNRSTFYYEPTGATPEDLRLMRLIDEQYTACPFYGSRKMTEWLTRQGEEVNRKRVQRLMRVMGLEAIYPKPRLSAAGRGHKIYPYLLRGVKIERPDQVWSADITYVPMPSGFMYLAAVIDWYSRYVIGLEVVEHARRGVLPGDAGRGLEGGKSGGVQHRSGGAVHGGGVHGEADVGGGGGEHGRSGAGVGQRVRRAALEDSEIRRYLHSRL